MKVRHIAQVCRESMAAIAELLGNAATAWDNLTDRQRRMSTFVVHVIQDTLETVTPESVHNAWMGEMIHNEGFHYGSDAFDEKAHPNLVPWAELPASVQLGYALSIGVVRGFRDIEKHYELCTPAAPAPVVATTIEEAAMQAAVDSANTGIGGITIGVDPGAKDLSVTFLTQDDFNPPTSLGSQTDGGLTVEETAALREAGPSDAVFQTFSPDVETLREMKESSQSGVHFTGHNMLVTENAQAGPSEHEEVR